MLRKCFLSAVFLMIVANIGAQGIEKQPGPYSSIKDGTGVGNPPSAIRTKHGGSRGLKTSDGEAHSGRSAGVVIVRSNTDESGNTVCVEVSEPVIVSGSDLLQGMAQSLIFEPRTRRSSLLEIIWSGQFNISSAKGPTWGGFDQQVFFKCTVSQRGETVPCSGTVALPSIIQDRIGSGLAGWGTYHGYVEFDPKYEVTVEVALLTGPDTGVAICGDTITLKY